MISETLSQYTKIISICKNVFDQKTLDYGTSWRILRLPSITDQIYIKAKRIRTIQENGLQKVNELQDDIPSEFIGIINYCLIALMQIQLENNLNLQIPFEEVVKLYDKLVNENKELLANKNHDYGEAWREMRVSSMTDLILMKLLRIKQIEDNEGKTLISEGVDSIYQDMLNYSVFCLIKLGIGSK